MPHRQPTIDMLCLAFCRLGVAGLIRSAPGTWGTVVAIVFAPICFLPLSYAWRWAVLISIFVLGSLAATRAETLLGCKDPSQVVVDELLGLWVALLPFTHITWTELCVTFVLFRFFDIFKPWPVSASEHWFPAGWGVMLDDVVAGCMAMVCLAGMRYMEVFAYVS